MTVRAHVGIGSNVGDRLATIRSAVVALDAVDGVTVAVVSGVYETEPWGGVEQPAYYNAVVALDVGCTAEELLAELQLIEALHDRDRASEERWGPRTLDLDLLTFGDSEISTEDLTVPHPRLVERAFVLVPLMEVWPGGQLPDGTRLTRALMDLAGPDGSGLPAVELVVRLQDVPGVVGPARPDGPRAPGAVLSDDWGPTTRVRPPQEPA